MGSDLGLEVAMKKTKEISIHAPAWGATVQLAEVRAREEISIHAPAWGATFSRRCLRSGLKNFNPRSRMGSDAITNKPAPARRISIHAPAWGATPPNPHRGRGGPISIHAPAWGATVGLRGNNFVQSHFNPRSRMGSDWEQNRMRALQSISIHAPAWGATAYDWTINWIGAFQSTLPHGERLANLEL